MYSKLIRSITNRRHVHKLFGFDLSVVVVVTTVASVFCQIYNNIIICLNLFCEIFRARIPMLRSDIINFRPHSDVYGITCTHACLVAIIYEIDLVNKSSQFNIISNTR